MYRQSLGTPCPTDLHTHCAHGAHEGGDDITSTLEFTTTFGKSALKGARQRRRHGGSVQFAIHEDEVAEAAQEPNGVAKRMNTILNKPARRSSIAIPGARPTVQTHNNPKPDVQDSARALRISNSDAASAVQPLRTSRLIQAPKRPTARLSIVPESASRDHLTASANRSSAQYSMGVSNDDTTQIFRPARRGTIYIPNDDTTMPSMFMGIFSPIKRADLQSDGTISREVRENDTILAGLTSQGTLKREPRIDARSNRRTSTIHAPPRRCEQTMVINEDEEMTGTVTSQEPPKRAPRKSMLVGGHARRRSIMPLQESLTKPQESALNTMRVGSGDGKENVPPGYKMDEIERKMLDLKLCAIGEAKSVTDNINGLANARPQPHKSTIFSSTASSLAHSSVQLREVRLRDNARPKPAWNGGARVNTQKPIPVSVRQVHKPTITPIVQSVSTQPRVPTRFVIPSIRPEPVIDNHALLSENIANTAMYEDDWLSHQEIVITQLVNGLFQAAKFVETPSNSENGLRRHLLSTYNTDQMALMYRRLQAGLLYGALSIPNDILEQAEGLQKDLARKEGFVNLWLDNYDPVALEAALEVVIGRRCDASRTRVSDGKSPSKSTVRKRLQNFIEIFLLRNEDGRPDKDCRSRVRWSYQRTMLRSLMLIKALDMIKTNSAGYFGQCLFRSTATLKSSVAVIQALFQMLNTATGDPIRSLGHIDYHVSHVQYPLEEFDYNIDNIAVDLRDGVCLTRLVELLLFPSASQTLASSRDIEATTTIMMPEGENLDFQEGQDWPLSQHLKLPCQPRAARLWNVQIVLSAVKNVKGMASLVDGISAEDIVDGFREKTIRLLWSLVGKWGLAGLIDWTDVEWEIRRLDLRLPPGAGIIVNNDELDEMTAEGEQTYTSTRCKHLLRRWAQLVAATHGLRIHNFTTSFSDGKAFEAVVSEYETYLSSSVIGQTASSPTDLSSRLSNLGCSNQFAQLFSIGRTKSTGTDCDIDNASNQSHIFDRDFVLAALAFLASRLLSPTKKPRAAVVIQRRWRTYWMGIVQQRKTIKRGVAFACADFVNISKKREDDKESVNVDVEVDVKADVMGPTSPSEADIWLNL